MVGCPQAASDAGVKQFIFISVHDFKTPSFVKRIGYFDGKRRTEKVIGDLFGKKVSDAKPKLPKPSLTHPSRILPEPTVPEYYLPWSNPPELCPPKPSRVEPSQAEPSRTEPIIFESSQIEWNRTSFFLSSFHKDSSSSSVRSRLGHAPIGLWSSITVAHFFFCSKESPLDVIIAIFFVSTNDHPEY